MNTEGVNLIINNLANKLAVPTEQLLEALSYAGIKSAIYTGVLLLAFLFMSTFACYAYWKDAQPRPNGEWFPTKIICSVFAFTFGIGLVFWGADLVLWLSNPKAWAISYLLSQLSGY